MNQNSAKIKALFISPDGNIYPDFLICSGKISDNGGSPCPFSQNGHMPEPKPLNMHDSDFCIDKGQNGDYCPPCAKQQLGNLGHWNGHRGQQFSEELKPLRLFKCSQWYWVVVLGLYHDNPTQIKLSNENDSDSVSLEHLQMVEV